MKLCRQVQHSLSSPFNILRLFHASKLVAKFIDMRCTTGPTNDWHTAAIFYKTDSVLAKNEIPRDNCNGFSLNNTRANLGALSLIKNRMLANNKVCCFLGCCFFIYKGYWFWCRGFLPLLALLFWQKLKAKKRIKRICPILWSWLLANS